MSKKLNLSSAIGIFLIGIFSANVSQAQYTNAYWDVNGTTTGEGGSGTFSSSGVLWTTNSVNATAASGGPTGGGLFALITGPAGTVTNNNSGGYNINFGGTAGNVKQGGSYQAASVNFLSSGYNWWVDAAAARTISTTNGINLNGNALTLSNGTTGVNSFTFDGPTAATSVGIIGTTGASLSLKNSAAYTAGVNSFGVYLSGGTISSNIAINVDIGAGSKIFLGSQSSAGATINSAITLNTNASGEALNITNSNTGNLALNGVVSGVNGLVLDNSSSGSIQLNGTNTYAGGTTVNSTGSGSIRYTNSSAFGSGTVSISAGSTSYLRATANATDVTNAVSIGTGATLQLATTNSGYKSTWSGVISGAGGINYGFSDSGLYLMGTNSSFGGGVNVSSTGVLFVNKLGNAGGNSSIGTNGTITISTTSVNQSTIRWTGTANDVSDKSIVLSSTGGLSLLADGATNSSLTIGGNITTTGTGDRKLTFAGYNTNTLTLNGVINENGGVNSVVIGASSSGTVVLGNANNSFSGAITITNSTGSQYTTLSAANIGNSNANSALGKNGTINMAGTSASAITTLKYTGTGETSDKVINFMSANGGAVLDQSGTGNLKFTSAMTNTGVGAKEITLQGSTAGTGQLAGAISDLGGVTSLKKSGSGAWTLSGSNSYTGLTTVSAGTLTLSGNNSAASGGVTLTTGGTLNINNNNALGSGALALGGATIDNTSGSAVVNAGNNNWSWNSTTNLTFGSATNTAANNLNLGTGTVTLTGTRGMNLLGTGTKLTIGDVINGVGNTITVNGNGTNNTLEMRGLSLSTTNTPANVTLAGTANIGVTGAIVSGTVAGNGLVVSSTGTTTLSGNNTYTGITQMNAAGGTLTLSGNNSLASGGVTLSAGTLNINNNNALGSGALILGANTINNTSGTAVVNAGNQAWTWTDGLAFGSFTNSAANNLNLGTGVVTASSGRTIALAGSDTKLTIGALNITSTSSGRTITANGVGNTLEMGGMTLSASATPVTVTLAGTANIGVTGAIVTGTTVGNGLTVTGTGTTTLSGNNTYTGLTTMNAAAGTLTLSGSNSAASGGVTLTAGALNVNSANALGSGTLTLTAGTINNTSGAAVVNSGNNAVTLATGLTFGTLASTSSNDLDLGAGTVTVSTSRALTLLGTGTTLKMGTLENTSGLSSRTFTFDGAGNTMLFRGFNIATTTASAATNSLAGSANLTISGVIANGNGNANGVNIKGTGTTTFSGANTYTGGTEVFSGATLLYGANNVTADAGGQMAVSGILDIASYNDTVSSVKVNDGGLLRGTTGVLTAGNFDITGANTVSAILGGSSATLTKGMSNTVSILSGNNTYGGSTTVSGGTLKLGSSTALGTTNGITDVGSAGFLDLNGQTGVAEALNYTGTGGLLNSATGTTATVSGAVDIGSGMTVETTGNITLSGQLTGSVSKNLTKSGAGILKVTAANSTFAGTNTVSAGTLLVDTGASVASSSSIVNAGLLKVNGTAGTVTVNIGGTLGGSGTVGALTVANGAFLTPGNSPGTLNARSASLLAGSTYNWEINSAAISASAGTNWDLLNVTNDLNLSTLTTSNKLNLVLKSLDSAGLGTNSLSGFTIDTAYSWVFAQAASITNSAFTNGADVTDYFNINTTAFNNDALPAGYFKVQVGQTITEGGSTLKTLQLMTIPEPSTGSMLGLGFAGLVVTRLLRRKTS